MCLLSLAVVGDCVWGKCREGLAGLVSRPDLVKCLKTKNQSGVPSSNSAACPYYIYIGAGCIFLWMRRLRTWCGNYGSFIQAIGFTRKLLGAHEFPSLWSGGCPRSRAELAVQYSSSLCKLWKGAWWVIMCCVTTQLHTGRFKWLFPAIAWLLLC